MVKILLVLMLCGATVVADCGKDSVHYYNYIGATYTIGLLPKHDTTRNYIKEIKQKCNTTFVPIISNICDSGILRCGCGQYTTTYTAKIECVNDTVWTEKVQVWLTPEQLKELMRIIDVGVYWERDTSVSWRDMVDSVRR